MIAHTSEEMDKYSSKSLQSKLNALEKQYQEIANSIKNIESGVLPGSTTTSTSKIQSTTKPPATLRTNSVATSKADQFPPPITFGHPLSDEKESVLVVGGTGDELRTSGIMQI